MNSDQFHENYDAMREAMRQTLREQTAERDLEAEAEELFQDLKAKAAAAAKEAIEKKVTVRVTARGRISRNGPCPCGSGKKFKRCCWVEFHDPNSDKKLPSLAAVRAYLKNYTFKD